MLQLHQSFDLICGSYLYVLQSLNTEMRSKKMIENHPAVLDKCVQLWKGQPVVSLYWCLMGEEYEQL